MRIPAEVIKTRTDKGYIAHTIIAFDAEGTTGIWQRMLLPEDAYEGEEDQWGKVIARRFGHVLVERVMGFKKNTILAVIQLILFNLEDIDDTISIWTYKNEEE